MVDLLLRNTEKTTSAGLYNGKAGLSLSLFVASGYLQDESVEDVAFRLLQESLILTGNDVSFENGLAGSGYALLYLIEKKYIEADFDEIFEKQYERFIKSFENIDREPLKLINSLQIIYFLSKVSLIKNNDERTGKIMKKIFEGLEVFLIVQFHDFDDIHYINKKADVLNIYAAYLKLIDYSGYYHFSHVLLEYYAALYRKGRIVSSLETGFYLDRIVVKYNISGYDDIIHENIFNGIHNMHVSTLLLRERIDSLKIMNAIQYKDFSGEFLFPNLKNSNKDKALHDLLRTVDEKSFSLGYGAGLGRFLIYCVNKDIELL
jgi:hypothetical protein